MDSTTKTTQESAHQVLVRNEVTGFWQIAEDGESGTGMLIDQNSNPLANNNGDFYPAHLRNKLQDDFTKAMLAEANAHINDRSRLAVQEQLNILVEENKKLKKQLEDQQRLITPALLNIASLRKTLTTLESNQERLASNQRRIEQTINRQADVILPLSQSVHETVLDVAYLKRAAVLMSDHTETVQEERKIDV